MYLTQHPIRSMGIGLLLLITAGLAFLPRTAWAQAVNPDEAIRIAVVAADSAYAHLQAGNPISDGGFAVAVRRHVGTRMQRATDTDLHDPAFVEGVANALDAEVSHALETRSCPTGPGSCRMHGTTTVVLVIGVPEVDGDEATVLVDFTYHMTRGSRPIQQTGWTVVLNRHGEGWQVTEFVGGWTT